MKTPTCRRPCLRPVRRSRPNPDKSAAATSRVSARRARDRDMGELFQRELEGVEVLRLYSRLSSEQQSKIFSAARASGSCSRPMWRRHRLPCRAFATSSIRGWRESAVTVSAAAYSGCPSRPYRAPAPTSARDAAAGWGGAVLRLYSQDDFEQRAALHRAGGSAHQSRGAAVAPGGGRLGEARDSLSRSTRFSGARRRLSAAARAAGARHGPAHYPPWPSHGAAAARPALARALLESKRFRAEGECWPSSPGRACRMFALPERRPRCSEIRREIRPARRLRRQQVQIFHR